MVAGPAFRSRTANADPSNGVGAAAGAVDAAPAEQWLVEQAKDDPDAFAVLYRRYVGPVYGFAFKRSGSREVAEEVTSATFERVWRSLPDFVWRGGGFEPWMWRIAATELAGWYRQEQRPSRPRAQLGFRELAATAAHDHGEGDEIDVDGLRAALGTLRPRYQEAITLHFLSGLSTEEQASSLGCSKAVLAVTVHRAVAALRRSYVSAAESARPDGERRDGARSTGPAITPLFGSPRPSDPPRREARR